MKLLILLLLVALVLWIGALAWKSRRNANDDRGSAGGADTENTSSHCSHDNGSCDGGGDGGGD